MSIAISLLDKCWMLDRESTIESQSFTISRILSFGSKICSSPSGTAVDGHGNRINLSSVEDISLCLPRPPITMTENSSDLLTVYRAATGEKGGVRVFNFTAHVHVHPRWPGKKLSHESHVLSVCVFLIQAHTQPLPLHSFISFSFKVMSL